MIGCLALFFYCLIIGNFVDSEAFQIACTSLSLFVILLLTFLMCIYIYLFKKIPGKGKTIITYEYKFNNDNVMVKNISRNTSFILNTQNIKNHYVIIFYFLISNKINPYSQVNDI